MTIPALSEHRNDWARSPVSALLWWCVPLAFGFAASLLALPLRTIAIVWVIAFMWMGAGCVLNAMRCRRLHCYIAGPAFLLGALAAGLIGIGALSMGPQALGNIVSITLAIALLSFIPEAIWRRYI